MTAVLWWTGAYLGLSKNHLEYVALDVNVQYLNPEEHNNWNLPVLWFWDSHTWTRSLSHHLDQEWMERSSDRLLSAKRKGEDMWHESQALPMKWFLMSEKVSPRCVTASAPLLSPPHTKEIKRMCTKKIYTVIWHHNLCDIFDQDNAVTLEWIRGLSRTGWAQVWWLRDGPVPDRYRSLVVSGGRDTVPFCEPWSPSPTVKVRVGTPFVWSHKRADVWGLPETGLSKKKPCVYKR